MKTINWMTLHLYVQSMKIDTKRINLRTHLSFVGHSIWSQKGGVIRTVTPTTTGRTRNLLQPIGEIGDEYTTVSWVSRVGRWGSVLFYFPEVCDRSQGNYSLNGGELLVTQYPKVTVGSLKHKVSIDWMTPASSDMCKFRCQTHPSLSPPLRVFGPTPQWDQTR